MAHSFPVRFVMATCALALTASLALAQNGIAGRWTLDVDSPRGATKADLVLAVDGETVSGTIGSDMGESKFTGTAKDGTVTSRSTSPVRRAR